MDATCERLRAFGCAITGEPDVNLEIPVRIVMAQDPDCYGLELIEGPNGMTTGRGGPHDPRRLLLGEGPRWHDGELWFSDVHGHTVRRTTVGGDATIVAEILHDEPSGLGWLRDGRLLVVAMDTQKLLRIEPDGSIVEHADLSPLARGSINDMIVGADGTAYVGDMGTRIFDEGSERVPGQTIRVTPKGRSHARPTISRHRTATFSPKTAIR